MRGYIERAKTLTPRIPPEVARTLTAHYVAMRREEALSVRPVTYTSARSLLAIVRLACALARLRLSENVRDGDVLEAKRLVEASRGGLEENDDGGIADTGYSRTIIASARPGTVDDRLPTRGKETNGSEGAQIQGKGLKRRRLNENEDVDGLYEEDEGKKGSPSKRR